MSVATSLFPWGQGMCQEPKNGEQALSLHSFPLCPVKPANTFSRTEGESCTPCIYKGDQDRMRSLGRKVTAFQDTGDVRQSRPRKKDF